MAKTRDMKEGGPWGFWTMRAPPAQFPRWGQLTMATNLRIVETRRRAKFSRYFPLLRAQRSLPPTSLWSISPRREIIFAFFRESSDSIRSKRNSNSIFYIRRNKNCNIRSSLIGPMNGEHGWIRSCFNSRHAKISEFFFPLFHWPRTF